MGSDRQLFYESLQYRHTQKPIALLCDSKRDQVSPMNTKIRIRFIQERACHHPICDFFAADPTTFRRIIPMDQNYKDIIRKLRAPAGVDCLYLSCGFDLITIPVVSLDRINFVLIPLS